jgi:putative PIN family toxin of toxin-antitoxin system
MIYVVIDTNVLVSALISKNPESATIKVMRHLFACDFIPLINDDIISEYEDVLSRAKFNLSSDVVSDLLSIFRLFGEEVERTRYNEKMPDEDDRAFYEVSLSVDGSFLVTGNLKHFPITPRVVTPAEFLNILYS